VRETQIGTELKDMAQEVVRFGERCVQAGRDWLNERREDMTNRNEFRRDPNQPGQARSQHEQRYSQQGRGAQFEDDYQSDRYVGGRNQGNVQRDYSNDLNRPSQQFNRNQPYGNQFDERTQNVGWSDERGWDYEGGPERYASSDFNQDRNLGAAYRHRTEEISGQREFGTYGTGPGEYVAYGRQNQPSSDYNTYGQGQGYGQGSGYTRPQQDFTRQHSGRSQFSQYSGYRPNIYGGESAGSGGRAPMYGSSLQTYTDEGEMSGYRSNRFSGSPSLYGYNSTGVQSYRGRGPKNYTRSDERIIEEINERLTDDDDLDATDITVRCVAGTVTLEGTVEQRWMKHRAEDIADACLGVKEVDNRIQVTSASSSKSYGQQVGQQAGKAGKTSTTTGTPSQH